jgi:dUTP pyrophosphatase
VRISIQKLHSEAEIPMYHTDGSAGFDLHAIEEIVLESGETQLIGTGLAFAIDTGYEVQIRPRSGLAAKHGVTVLNAPGTIDSDYRGEIKVILINHGKSSYTVKKGTRIAQAIVALANQAVLVEVDSLDETVRGEGGFGSTGC